MPGLTNRGKKLILDVAFRAQNEPISYYVHLLTEAATLTPDVNIWSDVSANEISGGGYGEATLLRGTIDFDTLTQDPWSDRGEVLLADISWNATGGSIVARYAALTDDAGGSSGNANNNIICYWDFGSTQTAVDGTAFTLTDFSIRINEG